MITNFVAIKQDITEQKIMQDQLQKQNDYLSILHQITLDLLNRRELNDLLQVVVDRSAVLLDAPFSELMLEEDGVLVVESFTDNLQRLKGDRVTRQEAKLSWQAFDTHQPVVLEDYATWEHRREIYDPNHCMPLLTSPSWREIAVWAFSLWDVPSRITDLLPSRSKLGFCLRVSLRWCWIMPTCMILP